MARTDEPDFVVKNIQQLFTTNYYKVPRYQREYAWGSVEIQELLTDFDEFYESDEPYYLLGQIVLVDLVDGSKRSEIVDGQQRITSLFLLLCAISRRLKHFIAEGESDDDVVAAFGTIKGMLESKKKAEQPKQIRLQPANDAEVFLQTILDGELSDEVVVTSNTEANIKSNFDQILKHLEDEKYKHSEVLYNYFQRLINDVYVVNLTVDNHEQALAVFEKMNDRGMPLNSADLLKNLLFSNTSYADYEILSEYWNSAAEGVFKITTPKSAASMDFLLKAYLSSTTGNSVPKRLVYNHWKTYLKEHPEKMETFGSDLQIKAQSMNRLSRRRNPNDTENNELFGTWFSDSSQQFTVLLAGEKLNALAFQELCKIVDSRFMLSSFAGERTQALEVLLSPWAKAVADLPVDATAQDVRQCSPWNVVIEDDEDKTMIQIINQMTELFESSRRTFGNLRYNSASDRKRLKYILARVSVYVEKMAGNDTEGLWDRILRKKGSRPAKPFDLEHVMPQSSSYKSSFKGDVDWINSIGNLVPLVPIDNTSAGKMSPSEKKNHYNSSELILTKSLCSQEDFGIGFNKRVQQAMSKIHGTNPPNLEEWDKPSVLIREEMYWMFFKDDLLNSLGLKEELINENIKIVPQQ